MSLGPLPDGQVAKSGTSRQAPAVGTGPDADALGATLELVTGAAVALALALAGAAVVETVGIEDAEAVPAAEADTAGDTAVDAAGPLGTATTEDTAAEALACGTLACGALLVALLGVVGALTAALGLVGFKSPVS